MNLINNRRKLIQLSCLFIIALTSPIFAQNLTLIPTEPAKSPNYWCTWYAQNYWVGRGTEIKDLNILSNSNSREELNEKTIFDKTEGWAVQLLPKSRNDYFFLIDHGWQIKDDKSRKTGLPFFSLQIEPTDFPRYEKYDQKQALKQFNDDIKALGWRGLGIWVRGNVSQKDAETFVKWSKYAGIEYWKIDGGDIKFFHCFNAKEKIYPELVLEYVTPTGPLNPKWDQKLPEYPSIYAKNDNFLPVLEHSDTFRTYDATPLLVTSTTLRRVDDILEKTQNKPKYKSILNLQDDVNAAAALGCLAAVKRHNNYNEKTYQGKDIHFQIRGKRMIQHRMDEAERFAIWQRIAPAFPAGQGSYLSRKQELIDYYPYVKGDTWMAATYGKMVHQSAPAVMARNMALPKVEIDSDPPFVMASKFPNGVTAVATEGRVKPENQWFHPRAKVTITISDPKKPIGIFGHYQSLVIDSEKSLKNIKKVWAQDLLADTAVDITSKIIINDNTMTIPGELIDTVGTMAATKGDISAPGLVLKLEL
ncbi:MAG: hypothetical protein JEZ07_01295 [Phycisphaerae bacterium]|nr:hypothetical protein [Phycisphaerae bacterium]